MIPRRDGSVLLLGFRQPEQALAQLRDPMRPCVIPRWSCTTGQADAVPAVLMSAQRSEVARQLARARWLLRRKRDGRYLATANRHGDLQALLPLSVAQRGGRRARYSHPVPATRRCCRLTRCGAASRRWASIPITPSSIISQRSPSPPGWPSRATTATAARCGCCRPSRGHGGPCTPRHRRRVHLEAISGFRSHAYQVGIFRRKLARGLSVAQILAVNAAPGFSEHHGGFALDIGTAGEPPAETTFEHTVVLAWLCTNAERFGFASLATRATTRTGSSMSPGTGHIGTLKRAAPQSCERFTGGSTSASPSAMRHR